MSLVGRDVPHESAEAHVTGEARFVDDLAGRFPGLAHAWPVCSPHAHARVRRLPKDAALGLDGVLDVLVPEDVPGTNDVGPARRDEPLIATEAAFHGQPVAWVVAGTESAARAGAAAIEGAAEYEPLEAVTTIEEAIEARSFLTEPLRIRRGDPRSELERSERRLQGELRLGAQEHFYLETQVAIAEEDGAGGVLVHSSTQHPSETQALVARVLGVDDKEVTVQCLRMGGAFGGKEVQANAWAAVAALGARRLGRPVRVRLSRRLDMALTGKRHAFLGRYRVGFDGKGKLRAAVIELFADGGWCLDLSEPIVYRAMFHVDNAYRFPHLEVVGRACRTHKASSTAFRGFGGPQGVVVAEEILDRVARAIGRPPHEVRRANLYREGDETHYGQVVKDAGRLERIWDDLRRSCSFEERWREVRRFNDAHRDVKRGIALTPVKFGISFTTAMFNQAGALVLVYRDGTAQVNHGGTEMGQGLHTKIAQIAADALGLPLRSIRLMPTRTDKVPNTSATAASSGSDLNGAAVRRACEEIRARLAAVAAGELGTEPDDVRVESGRFFAGENPEGGVPYADVVRRAYAQRVPLFATGFYRTPDLRFDKAAGQGKPFHYFAYGAAASEVEVDCFTGQFRLLRVDILHDVGDSLSPRIDRGQIEGGFLQGVGWLTMEEVLWDGEGRLLTAGASTYKLPTLGDCPAVLEVRLLEGAAEPTVVHGSKAVGEPPFLLAVSVREALRQAVAGPAEGPVDLGCPSTPEAVYFALERARARSDRSAAQ